MYRNKSHLLKDKANTEYTMTIKLHLALFPDYITFLQPQFKAILGWHLKDPCFRPGADLKTILQRWGVWLLWLDPLVDKAKLVFLQAGSSNLPNFSFMFVGLFIWSIKNDGSSCPTLKNLARHLAACKLAAICQGSYMYDTVSGSKLKLTSPSFFTR